VEVQPTLSHDHMGNAPSLPGLGGCMRYSDDADSSWKGRRPEGIPAENVETELIEVLEPSVSHNITIYNLAFNSSKISQFIIQQFHSVGLLELPVQLTITAFTPPRPPPINNKEALK